VPSSESWPEPVACSITQGPASMRASSIEMRSTASASSSTAAAGSSAFGSPEGFGVDFAFAGPGRIGLPDLSNGMNTRGESISSARSTTLPAISGRIATRRRSSAISANGGSPFFGPAMRISLTRTAGSGKSASEIWPSWASRPSARLACSCSGSRSASVSKK